MTAFFDGPRAFIRGSQNITEEEADPLGRFLDLTIGSFMATGPGLKEWLLGIHYTFDLIRTERSFPS